jgi:hypothetical protein
MPVFRPGELVGYALLRRIGWTSAQQSPIDTVDVFQEGTIFPGSLFSRGRLV